MVLAYARKPDAYERTLMLHLWRNAGMDTKAIGIELMFPEHVVYSVLSKARNHERRVAA